MNSDAWLSRKLWMTVAALGLITYGFKLVGAPETSYGTFCMAVLGATGLFKAANVLEKRQQK